MTLNWLFAFEHIDDSPRCWLNLVRLHLYLDVLHVSDYWVELLNLDPTDGFEYSQCLEYAFVFWDDILGRCVVFLVAQENMVE